MRNTRQQKKCFTFESARRNCHPASPQMSHGQDVHYRLLESLTESKRRFQPKRIMSIFSLGVSSYLDIYTTRVCSMQYHVRLALSCGFMTRKLLPLVSAPCFQENGDFVYMPLHLHDQRLNHSLHLFFEETRPDCLVRSPARWLAGWLVSWPASWLVKLVCCLVK